MRERRMLTRAALLTLMVRLGAMPLVALAQRPGQGPPTPPPPVPAAYAFLYDPTDRDVRSIREALPFTAITIGHSGCFGRCPIYTATLNLDGTAKYNGERYVDRVGPFSGKVGLYAFAQLSLEVERSGFMNMADRYTAPWTDSDTVTVSVANRAGAVKTVANYGGFAPPEMWALERAIEAVVTGLTWTPTPLSAQGVDRSQPPRAASGPAGEFTVRRLVDPIVVDGRTWIAAQPIVGAKTAPSPDGQFAIRLEETTSMDVVHFRVWFAAGNSAPVPINPGTATYAFITPDSRWIVTGTLEAIDVTTWRAFSLSAAFNIRPWVVIRAISADGRRLFVSRQDCPADCGQRAAEYLEITFPAR